MNFSFVGAALQWAKEFKISLSEMHKLIPQGLRNFYFIPFRTKGNGALINYRFNKQTGLDFELRKRAL